ncbi:MAG: HlyD family secretion protein [Planctomycetota bacterium]|jgi:multidrug resistance efflux pump
MTTKVDGLGLTAMQSVKPPRAARMLAIALFAMFLLLPPTLVLVPWQQNVQARGKVTALDPLDRVQRIPAPVTGRLVELNVQEGVYVERGEVLARMSDQDLGYALRLEQNLEYARNLVTAAEQSIDILGQQVVFAESARDQAVSAASSELEAARNAVSVAEKDLEAASAELEQKRLDYERKQRTYERGTSSQFDFQVAEREFRTAQAKSDAASTKVEQASNYRDAMAAKVENVRSGEQGKIEKIKSEREKARQDLASARTDLTEATTALERQNTQVVTAPRAGFVQRVYAASTADFLSQGSPLIELIPDCSSRAGPRCRSRDGRRWRSALSVVWWGRWTPRATPRGSSGS